MSTTSPVMKPACAEQRNATTSATSWFGVVERWSPEEAGWDGVGELWFDSVEAAEDAFATEPYHSMLVEDRKLLFSEAQSCFVTEHTVVPPP